MCYMDLFWILRNCEQLMAVGFWRRFFPVKTMVFSCFLFDIVNMLKIYTLTCDCDPQCFFTFLRLLLPDKQKEVDKVICLGQSNKESWSVCIKSINFPCEGNLLLMFTIQKSYKNHTKSTKIIQHPDFPHAKIIPMLFWSPFPRFRIAGTLIQVDEVQHLRAHQRLRARLAHPAGWITLQNTETGKRLGRHGWGETLRAVLIGSCWITWMICPWE